MSNHATAARFVPAALGYTVVRRADGAAVGTVEKVVKATILGRGSLAYWEARVDGRLVATGYTRQEAADALLTAAR